jgi:Outer membrane protein beta-barrel domain
MKKIITLRFLFILFILFLERSSITAQGEYKKGYVILKNGQKQVGKILYSGSEESPESVTFKSKENVISVFKPEEVIEFKVEEKINAIFRGFEVYVNIASDKLDRLESTSSSSSVKKKVFLQLVNEGTANLYIYYDFKYHYYLQEGSENPQELIYKRFMVDNTKFGVNDSFITQLKTLVQKNPSIDTIGYSKMSYMLHYIGKAVETYNGKSNKNYFDPNFLKRFYVKFELKAGVASLNGEIDPFRFPIYTLVGTNNFIGGIAINVSTPYLKRNLSFIQETMFSKYNVNATTTAGFDRNISTVSTNLLKLNFMIRYNIVSGPNFKLYINPGFYSALILSRKEDGTSDFRYAAYNSIEPQSVVLGTFIGLGAYWKNYSVEGRYEKGDKIGVSNLTTPRFTSYNLILGFKF